MLSIQDFLFGAILSVSQGVETIRFVNPSVFSWLECSVSDINPISFHFHIWSIMVSPKLSSSPVGCGGGSSRLGLPFSNIRCFFLVLVSENRSIAASIRFCFWLSWAHLQYKIIGKEAADFDTVIICILYCMNFSENGHHNSRKNSY